MAGATALSIPPCRFWGDGGRKVAALWVQSTGANDSAAGLPGKALQVGIALCYMAGDASQVSVFNYARR